MSTVLEQIEQQIAKLSSKAVKKNTGNIRTVADGVAKIEGLSDVMYNEMVQFPGGAIGIALNLEEDEVGCVVGLHVGEQLGKPSIALMGPAPFGFPSRPSTKIMELNLPCRPCSKHGQGPCVNQIYHQCLVDITPAQVAAEVRSKLGVSL